MTPTPKAPPTPGPTTFDRLVRAYREYAIEGCTTLPAWWDMLESEREHYRGVVRKMLAAPAMYEALRQIAGADEVLFGDGMKQEYLRMFAIARSALAAAASGQWE